VLREWRSDRAVAANARYAQLPGGVDDLENRGQGLRDRAFRAVYGNRAWRLANAECLADAVASARWA